MVNTFAVGKTVASGDGSGLQNLTISGFGTPKYVQIFAIHATAEATDTSDENYSWGHTDLTNEWCIGAYNEDTLADMECFRTGSTSRVIDLATLDSAGAGAPVIVDFASFNTTVTDGIQIEWNAGNDPSAAWILVFAFMAGDDLLVEVGDGTTNAALDGITNFALGSSFTSKQPELMIFGANSSSVWDSTFDNDYHFTVGFCHNETNERQLSQGWTRAHGEARQQSGHYCSSVAATQPYIIKHGEATGAVGKAALELTGFANAQFTVRTRDVGASQRLGYVALSWEGNVDIFLEDWGALFTAGAKSETFVGFAFELMLGTLSNIADTGRDANVTNNVNAPGVFMMTDDVITSHQISWRCDDNAADADCDMRHDAEWVRQRTETGGTAWNDPVIDSIDATGFSYTPVTTATAAKACNVLFLRDIPPSAGSHPYIVEQLRRKRLTRIRM